MTLINFTKDGPESDFACLDFHQFQMGMYKSGSLEECGRDFLSGQAMVNSYSQAGTAEMGLCGCGHDLGLALREL